MPALVIGTGFFALFDTIALSLLPLFAMSHGITSEVAVLFASALLLGDTTMQFPIGWLADRLGRERVHIGCGVVVVALLPFLPWAVGVAVAMLAVAVCARRGSGGDLYVVAGRVRRALSRRRAGVGEFAGGRVVERGQFWRAAGGRGVDEAGGQ